MSVGDGRSERRDPLGPTAPVTAIRDIRIPPYTYVALPDRVVVLLLVCTYTRRTVSPRAGDITGSRVCERPAGLCRAYRYDGDLVACARRGVQD